MHNSSTVVCGNNSLNKCYIGLHTCLAAAWAAMDCHIDAEPCLLKHTLVDGLRGLLQVQDNLHARLLRLHCPPADPEGLQQNEQDAVHTGGKLHRCFPDNSNDQHACALVLT